VKEQVLHQLNREQAALEIAAAGEAADTSDHQQSSTTFQKSKQIEQRAA
jgi:hypothetical protein